MSEERELPRGWIQTTLADICQIERGITFPAIDKNRTSSEDRIACLRTANIQDSVNWNDLIYIPRTYVKNESKLLHRNDILISMANSRELVGKVSFVNNVEVESVFGGFIAVIRTLESIEPQFLFYYLRRVDIQRKLGRTASQTVNIANLSLNNIYAQEILLPPLAEQQRIVSVIEQQFSRQDVAIATLKRVQANLKRARTALLKEAVEGTLTQKWRQAHPGTEPASTLLQSILKERRARWEADLRAKGKDPKKVRYAEPLAPRIEADWENLPEEWCWANMGQIAYIQGGIQKQPGRKPVKNAFPYLRVANVLRGYLDLSHIEKMELFENELETLRLQPGDLLVVEGNGSKTEIGRSALWNGEIDDCVHQNHIIRVRTTNVLSKYLDYYWNSPRGRIRVMKAAASTNGLYTLSADKIARIPIPLPPLAEQEQIVAEVERRLSQFEKQEAVVNGLLKSFEKQRQAILQRAFSGQLVPQDENDEPASVLLERIQQERKRREQKKAPRYLYPNMNGKPFKVDPQEVVQEELWGQDEKKVVAEQSELWQNTDQ